MKRHVQYSGRINNGTCGESLDACWSQTGQNKALQVGMARKTIDLQKLL